MEARPRGQSRLNRARSQSLMGLPKHRLSDIPRKIAQGMKSHRSNSMSAQSGNSYSENLMMRFRGLSSEHLHISRSQEILPGSYRKSSTVESMDLSISGKVSVRPIHPSILNKQHCFQVMSPSEIKYFSCRSADELNKWINSIKKSIQPTRDKQYRTDVGMNVWVVEAKGLSTKPKKRYYCEILLDKILYSRTTTKTKSECLFWGENFTFEDLPDFTNLTVNIYKDSDTKNKKGKRKVIGSVDILVENLDTNQEIEKWYPVTLTTTKGANGEVPSIRLKIRYQRVSILPLKVYSGMLAYIKSNYMLLCETLESSVSSKIKDEIAGVILRVLQPVGKAQEFLVDIVMNEVNKLADDNLVFRGNSFATKAMDTYMKMVGHTYLQDTLRDFILSVYNTNEDCEVDPSRSPTGDIESNRENLKLFVEKAWLGILNSSSLFPRDLQETFHEFQKRCANRSKDLSNNLISSSIFLRFLCPAILSPSLFHLAQEYPNEKTSRTLTLIAKVIQNLANFTRFGGKEEYMGFMNEFVENNFDKMNHFLDKISGLPEVQQTRFEGSIDHGRELTVLYQVLKDQLGKLNQDSQDKLRPLQFVLKSLQESYLDYARISSNGADQALVKKWASSSDLISEQEKDNITLTPVNQIKTPNQKQEQFSGSPQTPSPEWKRNQRRAARILPTPHHLIVAAEDIIVTSPHDLENRRNSSSTSLVSEDDLSSTTSSAHLRRHSYLNAVGTDEEDQPPRRNTDLSAVLERKSRISNFGYHNRTAVKASNGADIKQELSKSFTADKHKERSSQQRPWSLITDSSKQKPPTSPVITDRPRTLVAPAGGSPRTQRKASPLAIIDTITRSHTERDSNHSSPSSSPVARRRTLTPQQSPRLFRVRTEQAATLKQVVRTPSATSSSSSESSGSLRFGGCSADRVKRRHILPSTPNYDDVRRDSNSTTGSRTEDSRDDSTSFRIHNEEKNGSDVARELEEVKRALASTQEQLTLQESSTHKLVASIKERLAETETNLQRVRDERDREVKDLLDRLVSIENEMAKERSEMQEVLQAKQRIVDAQEKRIKTQDATNSRLMATMNQMKSKRDRGLPKQREKKLDIDEDNDEYV